MAVYGKTWWGKKWLETFTDIDDSNRLPRGRTYANTGRAHDINIKGNIITAKVQGSQRKPYKVEIILESFDNIKKELIGNIINKSPSVLSALINKKLPSSFFEELTKNNIRLFPSKWKEIKARCDCPDYAMPCKHIAAVIYLIAAEIDKNPFFVFSIHDCDLLDIIADFRPENLGDAQRIIKIEDLTKNLANEDYKFDQIILDNINFSPIPNLLDSIINILNNDPQFYDKKFREILGQIYKHWQRFPKGSLHNYYKYSERNSKNKNLSEEEIFINRWGHIEQFNSFSLLINNTHHLTGIFADNKNIFTNSKDILSDLILMLNDIPNNILHKLCPSLRLLHVIFQLSVKLMETSALIPQIMQNKEAKTFIRWIPALFNQEIKDIHNQLCSVCPEDLVKYTKFNMQKEEQIKSSISMIMSAFMLNNIPVALGRNIKNEIFRLFFFQESFKFLDFSKKELPNTISQWLSNLYISERNYKIYLKIEESEDKFYLGLQLSVDDKTAPVPINTILKEDNNNIRLSVLSDLAMIFEYIPGLEKIIDSSLDFYVNFSLNDFTKIFLEILPVLKAIGIIVILPKSLQKILKPKLNLNLKSKDKISDDRKNFLKLETLLDFDWQIAIGDKKISIAEFKEMLVKSNGIIKIVDEYVLLDEREIQNLLKNIDKLPNNLSQTDLMQAILSEEIAGASVDFDNNLHELFSKLNRPDYADVPKNLNAKLRPYQERGYNWLLQNIKTGFGSILADDMGLGKTLQVIATILYLKNNNWLENKNRVLIVVPTSLLSNWNKEIKKFAPDLKLHIYHGQSRELSDDYDILITSYGLARRDKLKLNKEKWLLFIIDEAQNIKNPNTEQTKAIKSIDAMHKIAMSGTPIENRLLEYWSIFDFTNKYYLGNPKQFKDKYSAPIEKERDKDCLDKFKKVTSPFILRRLKSDKTIINDLPDKIENNRYCSLTTEQVALYQEVVNISIKKIEESEGIERKGLVLKLINSLKQICNHPAQFAKKKKYDIEQSGKMVMLEEILLEVDNIGEKSIIFTQYTEMGKIISSLMGSRFGAEVPFLHGGLSRNARDKIVDDFQNLSNIRTLIVSLKAGGTGLNLTAASHVIHYDLWWNPAVEAQATDRAYRIGQKQNVIVHRLLAVDTFEERIDEMIKSKKELADLAIGTGESWITEMSTDQIKDLVKLKNI